MENQGEGWELGRFNEQEKGSARIMLLELGAGKGIARRRTGKGTLS